MFEVHLQEVLHVDLAHIVHYISERKVKDTTESEKTSKEEQNGTNFSSVAPPSDTHTHTHTHSRILIIQQRGVGGAGRSAFPFRNHSSGVRDDAATGIRLRPAQAFSAVFAWRQGVDILGVG